ncbi:MAG TPA: DNA polymerase I [Candidatus Cloacimonadota bacterium]|nr:DNA polymerase I [Candidatus Cloacimonadota bacterium]
MSRTLYLIDGTALLYRAHFAFIRNPLINSKGMNTSAIFGVVNSFMHFVETMNPEHVIIAFDRKGPTFRHEKSEQYKANRPPMPPDMIAQVEPVMKFFELVTIPEMGMDGWEADDVLGTLANHFKRDYEIIIVTGDKDYSQLVDDRIRLYDPMKDKEIDRSAVLERYGIGPEQFIDYLALMGDSSDNIPGVKGIGPKGAEKLLSEFGSLDGIYAHLDDIPEKVRTKLAEDKDNAYLSQDLATIALNAPITMPDPESIRFEPKLLGKAREFLAKYELTTLKRRLDSLYPEEFMPQEEDVWQDDIFSETAPQGNESAETDGLPSEKLFEAITVTPVNISELWQEISGSPLVSIDCETDSVDPLLANLVGISLCCTDSHAWYMPLAHQMSDNLPLEETLAALSKALRGKTLLGHNLKYDLLVFSRHALELDNPHWDTMLAAYIIDPGLNRYSLDACALAELHYQMQPISALIGKGKNEITFDLVEVEKASFYAAEDAWAVWMLYPIYKRKLVMSGLIGLYEGIELPLLNVLRKMEQTGVFIDPKTLSEIGFKLNREIKLVTDEIYDLAGYQFNLNSPAQLGKLLFEDLKLPTRKKTKTGFSTDNSVLEELAYEHKIADKIIQYRQLSKLDSTYVSALPKLINPHSGRVHTSFNQTVASTGRLSSTNPNLQNIPIRTELGREIRKAFVPQEQGWVMAGADYSQIELRLLALMSGDEVLLESFAQDKDIHRQMAARIAGKPLEEISSEERRRAKVINFGLLYGMGQRKLSRELGISLSEAKAMIEEYFAQFPSIRDYISKSVTQARRMHYCETIFGRRLYLPNISSPNQGLKSEAERVAVNMPIQGSAADLIKLAMIDIHEKIRKIPEIRMILQVHDELLFEVKESYLDKAREIITRSMENALPESYRDKLRLRADWGSGASWYEAH